MSASHNPAESEAQRLKAWRTQQRRALLAIRATLSPDERQRAEASLALNLIHGLPLARFDTVGFCWPIQGEPQLDAALNAWLELGIGLALPQSLTETRTLVYRPWQPNAPLKDGPMGIPYPDTALRVDPTCLLVPLVGFDDAGYRLGYGGGYFDRSLAAAVPRPLCIGVGFAATRIPTTHPQWYDIAMDGIVTEDGLYAVTEQGLQAQPSRLFKRALQELRASRGL